MAKASFPNLCGHMPEDLVNEQIIFAWAVGRFTRFEIFNSKRLGLAHTHAARYRRRLLVRTTPQRKPTPTPN